MAKHEAHFSMAQWSIVSCLARPHRTMLLLGPGGQPVYTIQMKGGIPICKCTGGRPRNLIYFSLCKYVSVYLCIKIFYVVLPSMKQENYFYKI
jgi:hypothetical protein